MLPVVLSVRQGGLEETTGRDSEWTRGAAGLLLLAIFLNMRGFPPLPGFFMKLEIIIILGQASG